MSKLSSASIITAATDKLAAFGQKIRPYRYLVFLLFVTLLYGFVLYRINSLSNEQPTDTAVAGQVQAAQLPRFNETVIKQLKSLQDNSVNVQTLFDEARNNPFQSQQ